MNNFQILGLTSGRSSFLLGLQAAAVQSSSLKVFETCCASARRYSTTSASSSQPPPLKAVISSSLAPDIRHRSSSTASTPWRGNHAKTPHYLARQQLQRRTLFTRVIKNYVELPPNYRDGEGLPFQRDGDLDQKDIVRIFGPGVGVHAGNKLLRILHGRRVAGTLEDPDLAHATSTYSRKQINAALAYLRKAMPVEEVINAGLRAEDELRQLEEIAREGEAAAARGLQEEQEGKGGDGKPPGTMSETLSAWQSRLYKDLPKEDVYGVGVMDAIRARNEARWEEEVKRREKEQRLRDEEEAHLNPGKLQKAGETAPRQLSSRMQAWTEKATSDLEEPPQMTHWERLRASYVLGAAVLVGGLVLSSIYQPPQQKHRVWPDITPAKATILALIGLKLAIFVAWKLPPLWGFLNRYFILVSATPRAISTVTAMFSHQKLSHIYMNLLFLYLVGVPLHDEIGRANFVAMYLTSGVLGFVGSLTNMVFRGQLAYTSMGASGGVMGVVACYFMLHKFEFFKIFGLPPDPYQGVQGLGFVGLLIGANILQLIRSRQHMLDAVSHSVGTAVGIAYGLYLDKALGKQEGRKLVHDMKLTEVVTEEKKPNGLAASPR